MQSYDLLLNLLLLSRDDGNFYKPTDCYEAGFFFFHF
jgi:hypothetical protein